MKAITIKHLREQLDKSYIGSYVPIRIYRTYDKHLLNEDEEYICNSACYRYGRLELGIIPIKEWIDAIYHKKRDGTTDYAFYNIVNVENILDILRRQVNAKVSNEEYRKKEKISYEEYKKIIEDFEKGSVVFTLDGHAGSLGCHFKPIISVKNSYRTHNDRTRLFFYIADCKNCKYHHKKYGCTNVESDNYGSHTELEECSDYVR